jgi:hypothetical protein
MGREREEEMSAMKTGGGREAMVRTGRDIGQNLLKFRENQSINEISKDIQGDRENCQSSNREMQNENSRKENQKSITNRNDCRSLNSKA